MHLRIHPKFPNNPQKGIELFCRLFEAHPQPYYKEYAKHLRSTAECGQPTHLSVIKWLLEAYEKVVSEAPKDVDLKDFKLPSLHSNSASLHASFGICDLKGVHHFGLFFHWYQETFAVSLRISGYKENNITENNITSFLVDKLFDPTKNSEDLVRDSYVYIRDSLVRGRWPGELKTDGDCLLQVLAEHGRLPKQGDPGVSGEDHTHTE